MKWLLRATLLLLGLGAAAVGGVLWLDRAPPVPAAARPLPGTPEQVARGEVLALAGNCVGCHTARGGVPYAGGRAIETPFGTVHGGNLTPDDDTGIGRWSPDHFWRALQHGRGFDGRRLVPVFPYTEFTRVSRADSDALYAWLRTLKPVSQANREHTLRWPYNTSFALAAWRVLFFRPGEWQPDTGQSAEWNRGAYLVNGLGHCSACHGGRNLLGAVPGAGFGGGLIPTRNWYAPSLTRADEAGVADWPLADIVALLQTGTSPRGVALGPMAEVVLRSTQHLPAADLQAMALYLKSLPAEAPRPRKAATEPPDLERIARGAQLYETHCAGCHGSAGEGGFTAEGRRLVPPLAGNRSVTMDPPANLVRAIALGGFGPATAGHPRPFGMPPFAQVLSDEQIGAVATFLRASWGAQASAVSGFEVSRYRGGSSD